MEARRDRTRVLQKPETNFAGSTSVARRELSPRSDYPGWIVTRPAPRSGGRFEVAALAYAHPISRDEAGGDH